MYYFRNSTFGNRYYVPPNSLSPLVAWLLFPYHTPWRGVYLLILTSAGVVYHDTPLRATLSFKWHTWGPAEGVYHLKLTHPCCKSGWDRPSWHRLYLRQTTGCQVWEEKSGCQPCWDRTSKLFYDLWYVIIYYAYRKMQLLNKIIETCIVH